MSGSAELNTGVLLKLENLSDSFSGGEVEHETESPGFPAKSTSSVFPVFIFLENSIVQIPEIQMPLAFTSAKLPSGGRWS
jgi:hypothetical protein